MRMALNIETITPVKNCTAGLVSQICGMPVLAPATDYMLGYQVKYVKDVIGSRVTSALAEHDITLGTNLWRRRHRC